MTDNMDTYPPGSEHAKQNGCRCPALKNNEGNGLQGQHEKYWTRNDCPLHGEHA